MKDNNVLPNDWQYVNLQDKQEMNKIYQTLKYFGSTIHFYLDQFVFPTYNKILFKCTINYNSLIIAKK